MLYSIDEISFQRDLMQHYLCTALQATLVVEIFRVWFSIQGSSRRLSECGSQWFALYHPTYYYLLFTLYTSFFLVALYAFCALISVIPSPCVHHRFVVPIYYLQIFLCSHFLARFGLLLFLVIHSSPLLAFVCHLFVAVSASLSLWGYLFDADIFSLCFLDDLY